jgi:hypothetical protein
MKKLLMMLFLFLISIFSYAEKTAEEIMSDLREKEQEKIKQQEEVKKQKQTIQAKIEKEAEELMEAKRKELISEPLVDKFYRSENKVEASKRALEIGKSRMSFIKVQEDLKGETEDTLTGKYGNTYDKFEENSKKMQEILEERKKIQEQLRQLDELEKKVKN